MGVIENVIIRKMVFVIGGISTLCGIIGVFLPLIPTTPFILLAAWCFYKSSPKAYLWLRDNQYLGPPLKDWEDRRAISRKTKISAILMITISVVIIWNKVELEWLKYCLTLLLISVSIFIITRKES